MKLTRSDRYCWDDYNALILHARNIRGEFTSRRSSEVFCVSATCNGSYFVYRTLFNTSSGECLKVRFYI